MRVRLPRLFTRAGTQREPLQHVDAPSLGSAHGVLESRLEPVREVQHEPSLLDRGDVLRRQLDVVRLRPGGCEVAYARATRPADGLGREREWIEGGHDLRPIPRAAAARDDTRQRQYENDSHLAREASSEPPEGSAIMRPWPGLAQHAACWPRRARCLLVIAFGWAAATLERGDRSRGRAPDGSADLDEEHRRKRAGVGDVQIAGLQLFGGAVRSRPIGKGVLMCMYVSKTLRSCNGSLHPPARDDRDERADQLPAALHGGDHRRHGSVRQRAWNTDRDGQGAEAAARAPAVQTLGMTMAARKLRPLILICDDELPLRELIKAALGDTLPVRRGRRRPRRRRTRSRPRSRSRSCST